MAFRADDSVERGRDRAFRYLLTRHISPDQRERSEAKLYDLITLYGPVVDAYPHWHPLVASWKHNPHFPNTLPSHETGYEGLDHTVYLRNAFITCPYADGQRVLDSVDRLNDNPLATIRAEVLDVEFYMPNATPVLVKCDWQRRPMESDGTIPKSVAVPLLLEIEIPRWRTSKVAETWETMRPYILGEPSGSRSSLFVNQETGQALKTLWNSLIYTGMFGPIYVG